MNTQLKEQAGTRTPTETPSVRPRPVWTEPEEGGLSSQPARRKVRWIVLMSAMAATAAAVVWVIGSIPTGEPMQRPAFDSPGGNSLNIPAIDAPVESAAFDSPGGNSLNIPPRVVSPVITGTPTGFDSPGGNSLNLPAGVKAHGVPSGFDSPGGNSPNIP